MKTILCRLMLLVIFTGYAQANNLNGQWSGIAKTDSEETQLSLTISSTNENFSVSMSLLDIGVSGWPAQSVEKTNNILNVIFASDSGLQKMRLSVDRQLITGTWQESNFSDVASIKLSKVIQKPIMQEKRLSIDGPAGKLGASLIMPKCESQCPSVVFLHGSGAQPRDANRFSAYELAKQGIASIIYDKRGVGESEGDLSNVTFEALADDAIAIAEYLRKQPEISIVGFFGHSQGGWVAPLASLKWKHAAFVITSAGPAVPPAREAEWDVVRQLRAANVSTKSEEEARKLVQRWHQGIRSGDWPTFEKYLDAAKIKSWFSHADFNNFSYKLDDVFSKSYLKFMDYEPMPVLTSLRVPLLAILATDDESIDAVETQILLQELKHDGHNITLKIYDGYNHSMRKITNNNKPVRWPTYPYDYFGLQVLFIKKLDKNCVNCDHTSRIIGRHQ